MQPFRASRILRPAFSGLICVCLILDFSTCRDDVLQGSNVFIAKYPENKPAAISFTFDDGLPSGPSIIAPLFMKYNYRASFYVIVGSIGGDVSWNTWRNLSDQGFEIGNHSLTHKNLKDVYDSAILEKEIFQSYEILKANMGKAPFAFVHPFHGANPVANSFIFKKHYATRLCPNDFAFWDAWLQIISEEYVKRKIRETISKGLWYVPCAHGIGDGWGPISEQFLINILDFVKENESKIHLDTFEHLAKYRIERENTQLIISKNANGQFVELRSSLDPEIFDVPLCVVLGGQGNSGSLNISATKGSVTSGSNGMDVFVYAKPNSAFVIN